jgi:lactoylglutathione lyase
MLPRKLGVVMITVSDMDRSVRFYRDVLGLPLRFQSPDWSEFETEAVTLALHGGGVPCAEAPHHGPPVAGTVSTGWQVEDLDAVYAALKAKGVPFVMEPTTREEEGIRLALFRDPDGCVLSLAEVVSR